MPERIFDQFEFVFDNGQGIRSDQVAGLDGLQQMVNANTRKTHDIQAGSAPTGWVNANNDGSQGGMAVRSAAWTETAARTNSSWRQEIDSGLNQNVNVVRVPHGTDPHQARVVVAGQGNLATNISLSTYFAIGSSADSNPQWDYYTHNDRYGSLVTSITLQVTGTAANYDSTWEGNVVGSKVVQALDALSGNNRLNATAIRGLPSGSTGITQTQGDARYLQLTGVSSDLGDADDLRNRIRGELSDSSNNRTITNSDWGKILHYWGSNTNVVWTLPNFTTSDRGRRFFVNNGAVNDLTLNPHSSDSINGGTAGAGVTLSPNEFAVIWVANAAASGNWIFRKLRENTEAPAPVASGGFTALTKSEYIEVATTNTYNDGTVDANNDAQSGTLYVIANGDAATIDIDPDGNYNYDSGTVGVFVEDGTGPVSVQVNGDEIISLNSDEFVQLVYEADGTGLWFIYAKNKDEEFIQVVNTLPNANAVAVGQVLYLVSEGNFYIVTQQPDATIGTQPARMDFMAAGANAQRYGVVSPRIVEHDGNASLTALGTFTHNPLVAGHPEVQAITVLRDGDTQLSVYALVSVAAYEAQKGSSIASNDPLTITASRTGQTARTVTGLRYRGATTTIDNASYAAFSFEVDGSNFAAIETNHAAVFNFYELVRTGVGQTNDTNFLIYAASTASSSARLSGITRGFTLTFANSEARIATLQNQQVQDANRITHNSDNITQLQNVTTDLSYGDARVVSFANVTTGDAGLSLQDNNWSLGEARALSQWSYNDVAILSNVDSNDRSFLVVRLPHGMDQPALYRVNLFDNFANLISHLPLTNFTNLGNSADTVYSYYTIYKGAGTDGVGPIPHDYQVFLQRASGTTHVGQTIFNGKIGDNLLNMVGTLTWTAQGIQRLPTATRDAIDGAAYIKLIGSVGPDANNQDFINITIKRSDIPTSGTSREVPVGRFAFPITIPSTGNNARRFSLNADNNNVTNGTVDIWTSPYPF